MRGANFRPLIMGAVILLFLASGFLNASLERQAVQRTAANELVQIRHLQRIAAQSPGPKLIVAGGSNVIFGINAAQIGRELGINAVNLGMWNLLAGPNNYEKLLRSVVRPGDIVVYADVRWFAVPSTGERDDGARFEDEIALSLVKLGGLEFRRNTGHALPVWTLVPTISPAVQAMRLLRPAAATVRDATGDWNACVSPQSVYPLGAPNGAPPPAIFDEVRRIEKLTSERGATLVLEVPQLLIDERQRKSWEGYRAALENGLKPIAPLVRHTGKMADPLITDASLFCDLAVHLRPAAGAVRSAQLAAWLAHQPMLSRLRAHQPTRR